MYRPVEPLLENTLFEGREKDGKIVSYRISPKEGYKIHEITLDENVVDEYGNETGEIKKGFTASYVTCGIGYDFEKNERLIYAVRSNK